MGAKGLKKLDKRQTPQQQQYMRGAIIMFEGEAYRLEFTKGPQRSLQLHDDLMILTFPEIPSEDTVCKMITHWYRTQAVEIMKTLSIECHEMMRAKGVPLPPITIHSMKTR